MRYGGFRMCDLLLFRISASSSTQRIHHSTYHTIGRVHLPELHNKELCGEVAGIVHPRIGVALIDVRKPKGKANRGRSGARLQHRF